ncbi:uncharacterized protein C8Q71DRAFT_853670 [Rhodofomes roseus]|uniref:Uncharacterized protein n=1 Tax=Rhodofomes roseus TaxID=34475 RepID=A0A4Y9Y034_9APHY|nr:uncharacterized protein C8Q71DRAFT_853670 [Rhodofomes roseus]KAH9843184.1 hypothetical protein C8Q71DRAFT_853670 [Rhodofomes roseus]TFY55700.1 hypothetical protein EVJ58_g8079 [Rhodofomes roseus]
MDAPPPILNVHTPVSSFSIVHTNDDTLENLFEKLTTKTLVEFTGRRVRPGWVKYSWNDSIWNLDDDSDYTIFMWRHKSATPESSQSPVLYVRNPDEPLPARPAYRNPSFYMFRNKASGPSPPLSARGSTKSNKQPRKASEAAKAKEQPPKHKREFEQFHNENGVRTIMGGIGPAKNVRMLLKAGYRHVYISRKFAIKHGFIPADAAPGHYGYGGLVNIGKWPVTVGRAKTMHSVYLSEESHFDVVLGRSFIELRQVKFDSVDATDVVCGDTGEKIDCELIILKDGKGQIVTVT